MPASPRRILLFILTITPPGELVGRAILQDIDVEGNQLTSLQQYQTHRDMQPSGIQVYCDESLVAPSVAVKETDFKLSKGLSWSLHQYVQQRSIVGLHSPQRTPASLSAS